AGSRKRRQASRCVLWHGLKVAVPLPASVRAVRPATISSSPPPRASARSIALDDQITILCFLLVLPGLVAAALIFIQVQNFRIRTWRQTNGRIVSSRNEAREVKKIDHRSEGGD